MWKVIKDNSLWKNSITEIRTVETCGITIKAHFFIEYQQFQVLVKEEFTDFLVVQYWYTYLNEEDLTLELMNCGENKFDLVRLRMYL